MNLSINREQVSKWLQLNEFYSINLDEKIGEGAYGTVYRGYSKTKDCIIAVKVVKTNILSKRQLQTLKTLSSLDHPNIMGFYGDLKKGDYTYLFLQYCGKGTLADLIKQRIPQIQVLKLFREMVEGMCYMNAKQKMHRDFKPQNILIGPQSDIKICDFGLSQTTNSIFVTGKMGTPLYAAPEVFLMQNSEHQGYSFNCDVWGAGFILYEMLMGEKLFKYAKDYRQLKQEWLACQRGSKQARIHQKYHPLWNYFVSYMLQFDSKKRPTFHAILQKLKKVYNKMQESIVKKSNIIEDLNLSQVRLFLNYNMSKYKILLDLCQKFVQQDIRINNQFKYMCMFICLLRYNLFARKFIRDLRYKQANFQQKNLINNPQVPQVQMFCDIYRFVLEHRQAFYSKQLKQPISSKITQYYCKRNQSKEIINELEPVVKLVNRYCKEQVMEDNQELRSIYKSMLGPIKKRRDYKKFNQSQIRIYSLLLVSMLLEQKFPKKEYLRLNVEDELKKINERSRLNLQGYIQSLHDQICK